jgi:hypothetical protein
MENSNIVNIHSLNDLIKLNPYKSATIRDCIEHNFEIINNYVINEPIFCLNQYAFNHVIRHNKSVSESFISANNNKILKYLSVLDQVNSRYIHIYYEDNYWDGLWQGIKHYIKFSGDKKENDYGRYNDKSQDELVWNNLIHKMSIDNYENRIKCDVINKLGWDSRIIKYGLNSEINFGKYYGIKIKDLIIESSDIIMEYVLNFHWFSLSDEAIEYLAKDQQYHFKFLIDIIREKNNYKESYKEAERRSRSRYISNRQSRDLEYESDNSGSYAYDEAGYSDDDIDSAFDGDPENYWNID